MHLFCVAGRALRRSCQVVGSVKEGFYWCSLYSATPRLVLQSLSSQAAASHALFPTLLCLKASWTWLNGHLRVWSLVSRSARWLLLDTASQAASDYLTLQRHSVALLTLGAEKRVQSRGEGRTRAVFALSSQ